MILKPDLKDKGSEGQYKWDGNTFKKWARHCRWINTDRVVSRQVSNIWFSRSVERSLAERDTIFTIPYACGLRCNDQPEGDSTQEIPIITQNTCVHGSSLVELTPTLLYGGLYSCKTGKWAGLSSWWDYGSRKRVEDRSVEALMTFGSLFEKDKRWQGVRWVRTWADEGGTCEAILESCLASTRQAALWRVPTWPP